MSDDALEELEWFLSFIVDDLPMVVVVANIVPTKVTMRQNTL